jgi:hypothetical protein
LIHTGDSMLSDPAYHLIASLLEAFIWDGVLIGKENLQPGGGVIVANHMGAIGPVGVCVAHHERVRMASLLEEVITRM